MSCDSLASQAIATLGATLPPEVQQRLQGVYDQPPKLDRRENRDTLVRAAKALVLRLKAAGATIPDHIDLDSPRSKAAIKFGRLAQALSEAESAARDARLRARVERQPQTFPTLVDALASLPPDMPMRDQASIQSPAPTFPAGELAERARRRRAEGPYEVSDERYHYGRYLRTVVVFVGGQDRVVIYRENTDVNQ